MKKIIYGLLLILFPVFLSAVLSFLGVSLSGFYISMNETAIFQARLGIYATFAIAAAIIYALAAEAGNLPSVPLWIGTLLSLALTVCASFPSLFIPFINAVYRLTDEAGSAYQYDFMAVLYTSLFLLSFYAVITVLHYRRKDKHHSFPSNTQ